MSLLKEIAVPLIAVNDTSLTVVELSFANGSPVKKGDTVMVFETSKTTYNVEAEADGYIQYLCEAGNDYEVNDIVANIFSDAAEIVIEPQKISKNGASSPKVASEVAGITAQPVWDGETLFSHKASKLIKEKGLSTDKFSGRDFVSEEDVKQLLGIATVVPVAKKEAEKKQAASAALPVQVQQNVIVEKLSSNKKREIQFLSEVQSTGLTSTINTYVESEGFFVHVNQSLQILKNSLLPVVIYETARSLKKFPVLNSFFTGDAIATYKDVSIGFAIDIDKGLKVLRIPFTDRKSIHEVEESILSLSEKYMDDKLVLEDLTDVTFTITDLSAESVAFFRPLINMNNGAILGISSIDEKNQRFILSLTFDHRITEGKVAAMFLAELKARLESYCSKNSGWPLADVSCFKCEKKLSEDISDAGFVKCITPSGKEGFICQSCFKGF
jgi:pyruvate/2-oxoglutarate dehydrogenase complex dihydrolipoamide acyltransferase (E2) component